ncbi:MAG: DciA family protein [Pseudomonadota bacterium]|nr:DciA family protein [Pseudomonadota bacterium]
MKPLLNSQSSSLKKLMEQAELYQALLEVGQMCLPTELQSHLVGVSFESNTLILQIDDNIWTTQLRFFEPNLLNVYRDHFPHLELNKTQVKVLPISETPTAKRAVTTHPSHKDAEEMQNLAKVIRSKGLQEALLKLSRRADSEEDDHKP